MGPGDKGQLPGGRTTRSDRTTGSSHSAKSMAAMVRLNPILIILVLSRRTCAFVNSRNGRTKTNARRPSLRPLPLPC